MRPDGSIPEPMELAVVTDTFDPARGGRERYLFDLVRSLSESGCAIQLYCRRWREVPPGVSVRGVPSVRFPRLLDDWHFARQVSRRLRDRTGPVLSLSPVPAVTHYAPQSGPCAGAFAAERESFDSSLRRRLYRPATRLNARRRLMQRMEKRLLGGPDGPRVMANSRLVRDQIVELYRFPADRLQVLYPGVDLDAFFPAPAGPGGGPRLNLLFVANNFLLKGLHCLLRALARAAGLKFSLTVVGSGAPSSFRRLARRLGIAGEVTFAGPVARGRLADLYRRSDALVHPTFYDSFSLVVLEALACGCPVVTTARSGAAELIEPGSEGFVVENPRDMDGLAAAVLALRDPARRRRMSRAAARLGRRHDLRSHARKVREWLGRDDCRG